MTNQITYNSGRFSLVLDEFSSLNTFNHPYALRPSEFPILRNTLPHLPGLVRRGAVRKAQSTGGASSVPNRGMFYYSGLPQGGLSFCPYYCLDNSNKVYYYQTIGGAWIDTSFTPTLIDSSQVYQCGMTMADDYQVIGMGRINSGTSLKINPDRMILAAGTAHAVISIASLTMTTGSRSVTLGSALTTQQQADVVGSFVVNTQDTNRCVYRIISVDSSTSLTIDRAYAGSRSGTASTGVISPAYDYYVNPAADAASSGILVGRSCTTAWGRVAIMNTTSLSSSNQRDFIRNRIRWSGIIGSDEGTAPFTGMFAWDPNAYVDLPQQGGAGLQLARHGNTVIALQQYGMTVIYGQPVFDDVGSLDVSNHFTGIRPLKGVSTPYGFYFLDRLRGLMVWDGGQPRPAANVDAIQDQLSVLCGQVNGFHEIEFYRDYIIMFNSVADTLVGFLYHIPTSRWSQLTFPTSFYSFLQKGRAFGSGTTSPTFNESADQHIVAVDRTNGTGDVVVLSEMLNPGSGSNDHGNGTSLALAATSSNFGDPGVRIRPERMIVTYRLVDNGTDPALTVTVGTGLPTSFTSSAAVSLSATGASSVETVVSELSAPISDNGISVQVAQTGQSSNAEIYRIIVEGTVEGQATSS